MEEYNKNDKVEDVKENISAEEEKACTPEESDPDLLLKQCAGKSLERMYKLWWIPLVVIGISFIAIFFEIVLVVFAKHTSYPLLMIAGIGLLCLTGLIIAVSAGISAIAGPVLLYRYWKFLPAGEACTTPAKAVGYMFIPGFNLYWIFVVYWKLSKSYDKLLGRKTSSCTVVACIYAVFFCISSFFGYLSQISVFVPPELAVVSELMSYFTLPALVLYIAMTSLLQKTVREYLKGTVANWKNNPSFSRIPLVAGIITGIFFNILFCIFSMTAVIAKEIYKLDSVPRKEMTGKVTQIHTHSHHK